MCHCSTNALLKQCAPWSQVSLVTFSNKKDRLSFIAEKESERLKTTNRTRSKVKSYPLLREQAAGDCFFVSLTRQRVEVWFSKWPPHWLNAWKAVQGYLRQTKGSWKFNFKTRPQKSEHLDWSSIIIKKYSTNINSFWTWYWLVQKLLRLLKLYWETLCWSFLKALFACISVCMGTI